MKVNTALAALRCITSLTLRNPECARTLVNDQNAAEAIVNALNCHAKNKAATRAGKIYISAMKTFWNRDMIDF